MSKEVSLSTQSKAVSALEQEKAKLFVESARVSRQQTELLERFQMQMRDLSSEHAAIFEKIIALEDTQEKLLRVL